MRGLLSDRPERDGVVARRLGVRSLIRGSRPIDGRQSFRDLGDVLFAPLLEQGGL